MFFERLIVLFAACLLTLSSYAKPSEQEKDVLSPYNRAMFKFNDGMDHLILKPVAQGYLNVTPKPVVRGVHHFYTNLNMIPTIGNDLLQIHLYQASADTWRFLINSTVGVLGFFDPASRLGLQENAEDVGLTFASWGWEDSTYFVLPFFGPSTIRDALGKPVNYYLTVYPYIRNVPVRNTLYAGSVIDERANLLQMQGVIEQASLDPYVFQRNAYLQRRAYLIERNKELANPYLKAPPQENEKTLPVRPDQPKVLHPKNEKSYVASNTV